MWQIQLIVRLLYLPLQKYSPLVGNYIKKRFCRPKLSVQIILLDFYHVVLGVTLVCIRRRLEATLRRFNL